MKNFLVTVWTWITISSADPEKYSSTIKFALLGIIPYVLQATALACGFHLPHACVSLDQDALTAIIEGISNVAFWSLSLVSGIGTLWALIRKVGRTIQGSNRAINALG